MMDIELTKTEILETRHQYFLHGDLEDFGEHKAIAKAAQRKLVELIEAEIVIYKDGSLFAAGPIASAKWQELRKAVGL